MWAGNETNWFAVSSRMDCRCLTCNMCIFLQAVGDLAGGIREEVGGALHHDLMRLEMQLVEQLDVSMLDLYSGTHAIHIPITAMKGTLTNYSEILSVG